MELNNKLTILSLINEHKAILFGKFGPTLTHDDKIKKWMEITEQLNALGIFSRDWHYLRDTTWQNWRKRTIEKRDNRVKTGSGGGKKCQYDEVDHMVLTILGKDSPAVEGIDALEPSGSNAAQVVEPSSSRQLDEEESVLSEQTGPITIKRRQTLLKEEIDDLKKQKLEAEIQFLTQRVELAKREEYKFDLELYKLEKELGINRPSAFTFQFYVQGAHIVIQSDGEQTD